MPKSDAERQDDARIMKLFRGRCIVCMSPATQIHELVTRGRSKFAVIMPKNRVPLCGHDHSDAHHSGYTGTKEEYLRNRAIERLVMFGESLENW
jgi:hypothetical protein